MSYLSNEQIDHLTNSTLEGKSVLLKKGRTVHHYRLLHSHNRGMKGVVWKAKEEEGGSVALKFIPLEEYKNHSLIDEISSTDKLDRNLFAQVKGYGEVIVEEFDGEYDKKYLGIATRWSDGEALDVYFSKNLIGVSEFLRISKSLFSALANLENNDLCHDDLHPGNILIESEIDHLTQDHVLKTLIIDTGTIKTKHRRDTLLEKLDEKIENLRSVGALSEIIDPLIEFRKWKKPDDHTRIVESLLIMANSLSNDYYRMDFWERKFFDNLFEFFRQLSDEDLDRRLDDPKNVVDQLQSIYGNSKIEKAENKSLLSPFDYISAEMIRNDTEFSELFSKEFRWFKQCRAIEPLYIYGPRGCGKSTVLRWLSFKTVAHSQKKPDFDKLKEIGIYISCSVELRSRFWLLDEDTIEKFQGLIIKYFSLLVLEELFDTLALMQEIEESGKYNFGLSGAKISDFIMWALNEIDPSALKKSFRLQGQSYFDYSKSHIRKMKWETWSLIRQRKNADEIPNASLLSDISRELGNYIDYFKERHITFLLDDYSNQRIPTLLQRKLNSTISFAKQGNPLFKVSSEYSGVDLEGIEEGREAVEINIGLKYTDSNTTAQIKFLEDIVNKRLSKANYSTKEIKRILGNGPTNISKGIAQDGEKFHYHGINCIVGLCSGDLALALDLIRKIFEVSGISKSSKSKNQDDPLITKAAQHKTITQYSHESINKLKYIIPNGQKLHDIVIEFSQFTNKVVVNKTSSRKDKPGIPLCMTHIDIRLPAIDELRKEDSDLISILELLVSRAILFTLQTSRSRFDGGLETPTEKDLLTSLHGSIKA